MTQNVLIRHRRYADSIVERDLRCRTGTWMHPAPHIQPSSKGSLQKPRPKDRHVMLVQSGAIELRAVTEMIRALGFRVTPVEESGKALSCFGREPCEVVISELDMQQVNGYQLAWHIRQHSPRTRILLMTACCQAEVAEYMNDRVVDGWLFKPFGFQVLKEMLG
jgi:DNA-binding NtrC family response regulator